MYYRFFTMSGKVLEKSAYGVKYVPRRDDSSDESFNLSDLDEPDPIVKPIVVKRKKKSPVIVPKAEVRKPARALITLAPSAELVSVAQPKIMRGRQVDVLRHRTEPQTNSRSNPPQINDRIIECFGAEAVVGENPATKLGNCERVGRLQLLRADTETVLVEYYSRIMGQINDQPDQVDVGKLQQIDRVPRARSRSRSRKPAAKTKNTSDDEDPTPKLKKTDAKKPKPAAKRAAAKKTIKK